MADSAQQSIYIVFIGSINQDSTQRICRGITNAFGSGISDIHMLFQSTGGTVADGVLLYNFFRTVPAHITLYNSGSVASVAVISYLGAKTRCVSQSATFMMHSTHFSPEQANAGLLESFAEIARIDDDRTNRILDHHLSLSDEQKRIKTQRDLWLTAQQAKEVGLATDIREFTPAGGSSLFYV